MPATMRGPWTSAFAPRIVFGTETPAQGGRAFIPTQPHPARARSGSDSIRHDKLGRKGTTMEMPAILRGDSLPRLLQGAAAGAIATLFAGFYWGGWVTGATANGMVQRGSSAAVVTALSPICVDKFQHTAGAAMNLAELKKTSSYQQASFIEQGGWATLPGSDRANSAVARACAEMLNNLK